MTLTFVRHAQSWANVYGVYDSSIPGPPITPLGQQQAEEVATKLAPNAYDAMYVSPMLRTQMTAVPLSEDLGLDPEVLIGLREVQAGIFDGRSITPISLFEGAWVLGLRFIPIPGSINGNDFEDQFGGSVDQIHGSGATNAVAFSHQGAITTWVTMNVKNPDLWVILTNSLPNTGTVVVTGSPEEGWTLVEWNGIEVPAEPTFPNQLFVDVRTLVTGINDAIGGLVDGVGVAAAAPSTVGLTIAAKSDTGAAGVAQVPVGATVVEPDDSHRSLLADVGSAEPPNGLPDADRTTTPDAAGPLHRTVTTTGATDLTDGNKVTPGTVASVRVDDGSVQDTVPSADGPTTTRAQNAGGQTTDTSSIAANDPAPSPGGADNNQDAA